MFIKQKFLIKIKTNTNFYLKKSISIENDLEMVLEWFKIFFFIKLFNGIYIQIIFYTLKFVIYVINYLFTQKIINIVTKFEILDKIVVW